MQRNAAAVVKELLSDAGRRSCLKALNREGATPLHAAVQTGHLDIAQLLVNAGAKVDATDRVSQHMHAHVAGKGERGGGAQVGQVHRSTASQRWSHSGRN